MERGREGNTADLSQPELGKRNWESNTVDHQSQKREHTMDKKAKRKRSPNKSEINSQSLEDAQAGKDSGQKSLGP